ncbi:MAG: ATP-binding cassette domain-containing protein [Lentisphaerae bacterium]|nr:ATP-binding cassette domain-containing protein [Lentisphaerota bacterium]
MIKVANLTKRYGRKTAVDDVSFEVKRGEIVGFLGPNGAGKTTTMRILSTFLSATGGVIEIGGMDIFRESMEVRRRIGYLPENTPLYEDMRVIEYLRYRARLKGLHGASLRSRIDKVIDSCDLSSVARTIIGRLSKGYKKRVGLADALVHEPDLLILDEPTIGLDPNQLRNIRSLIRNLADRHTVLLSTHILSEVEMICERVLIISDGKIVASDTPANLVGLIRGNPRIITEIKGDCSEIVRKFEAITGVTRVSSKALAQWNRIVCECEKGTDVRSEIFRIALQNGWDLRELTEEKQNLEDVFVSITALENGNGQTLK